MSIITANGVPVLRGEIDFALQGAWRGEVVVRADETKLVTGAIVLALGDTELRGFALRSDVDRGGQVTLRLVAGAGGLETEAGPQHFVSTSRRAVLEHTLAFGGEALSPTTEGLGVILSHWTRLRGSVVDALRRLAAAAGVSWRFLPDGSVWMGTETWPAGPSDDQYKVVEEFPTRDAFSAAVEGAVLLPGMTVEDRKISGVRYTFDASSIRAEASYGATTDALAAHFAAATRRQLAPIDFFATYDGTIVGRNSDASLEVRPSDARLPGFSRLPVRHGIAGLEQEHAVGTKCRIGFDNGDPGRPVVSGFDATPPTRMRFDADAIELGGDRAFVMQDEFSAWVSSLTTAGVPAMLSVPPYLGPGSQTTKGT